MSESNETEKTPSESAKVDDVVDRCLVSIGIEVPVVISRRASDYSDDELDTAVIDVAKAVYGDPLAARVYGEYLSLVSRLRATNPDIVAKFTPCAGVIPEEDI